MNATSRPRRLPVVLVLSLAAIAGLAGCYTVLKHPPADLLTDDTGARRNCADCHGPNGPAGYIDPFASPHFEALPPSLVDWYTPPWWYPGVWYVPPGSRNNPVDTQDRTLWNRGQTVTGLPPLQPQPPAAPPQNSTTNDQTGKDKGQQPGRTMKENPTPPAPPSTGGSTGSGSGQSGSGNQNQGKDGKKSDDGKKQDDRNVWGRGGGRG